MSTSKDFTKVDEDKLRKEMQGVPRVAFTYREYWTVKYLVGTLSALGQAQEQLVSRCRSIPRGMWMLKTMFALGDRLLTKIYMTLPPKELSRVRDDLQNTECYIRNKGPAVHDSDSSDYLYVKRPTMNKLAQYACVFECPMCRKDIKQIKHCGLRRALAETFPHALPESTDGHCVFEEYSFTEKSAREIMESLTYEEVLAHDKE